MQRKIIKFGASWCSPCVYVNQTLDELKNETDIIIEHIDVDENDDLVTLYNVRNIPTLIYFIDDKEVNKTIGLVNKTTILSKFEN